MKGRDNRRGLFYTKQFVRGIYQSKWKQDWGAEGDLDTGELLITIVFDTQSYEHLPPPF